VVVVISIVDPPPRVVDRFGKLSVRRGLLMKRLPALWLARESSEQ